MKTALKFSLAFVIGLALGGGIIGYVMNRFLRSYMAETYAMNVAANALLAEFLKGGNADYVLEYTERNLVGEVQTLYGSDELKSADMASTALAAAKRFYVCTKTPIPGEIEAVMNDLPAVPASDCGNQPD